MTRDDQEHFQAYTSQNRIKHEILGKYFRAYVTALSRHAAAFHYIDAFAGRGTYINELPGSPLIALALLAGQTRPFTVSLVESDADNCAQLRGTIDQHPARDRIADGAFVAHGEFADFVHSILNRPIYSRSLRVATFAFIDPCGVKGVRMRDIRDLLSQKYGECLVFWNYDGVNRWLGLVRKGGHAFDGLVELFGDRQTVDAAIDCFNSSRGSADKERSIRELYMKALVVHSGAEFVLPFRVESQMADRTSHYLVHCSRHSLAFKIMKEVMGKASNSEGEIGVFQFLSESDSSQQLGLFPQRADDVMRQILATIGTSQVPVSRFTEEWVLRPRDFLTANEYKHILLDLESAGQLEVWEKTGKAPKPAQRRMKMGKVTLGRDLLLRCSDRSVH